MSGIILKDFSGIEKILEEKITPVSTQGFDDMLSVLATEDKYLYTLNIGQGGMVFFSATQMYDLSNYTGEVVQFIISNTADTFYFEHHISGQLQTKYISSQGEVYEDIGDTITLSDTLQREGVVWNYASDFLQIDFPQKMYEIQYTKNTASQLKRK